MLKLLLADWLHADVAAIPIREEVFIIEQNKAKDEEWDEMDEHSLHVIASLDGNAIGTARLEADGTLERFAVLKDFRNKGVGTAIVAEFVKVAKNHKFALLKVNTPRSVEQFFIRNGFAAHGEVFMRAGTPYIEMQLEL